MTRQEICDALGAPSDVLNPDSEFISDFMWFALDKLLTLQKSSSSEDYIALANAMTVECSADELANIICIWLLGARTLKGPELFTYALHGSSLIHLYEKEKELAAEMERREKEVAVDFKG